MFSAMDAHPEDLQLPLGAEAATFNIQPVSTRRCPDPDYVFHVYFRRQVGQLLGLSLNQTWSVEIIAPDGMIAAWNARCLNTFPRDQVMHTDVLISINGYKFVDDRTRALVELASSTEVSLVVLRPSSCWI